MSHQCIPSQTNQPESTREYSDAAPIVSFKLADTQSEIEQAFRLVSSCYQEKGYIAQSDNRLRMQDQHFLPGAAIFVGKMADRVVATSSVFPDSVIGLPADSIFSSELATLRTQGRRIAEFGALASNFETAFNPAQVPLPVLQIIRLACLYSQDCLQVDDLIITINPKHQTFYEKILLFEIISDIKFYPAVNHTPAIALRQNMHTLESRLVELLSKKSRLSDLRQLFFNTDIINLDFLPSHQPVNIWNDELLCYFLALKTPTLQTVAA
jgi:hypothetical protein